MRKEVYDPYGKEWESEMTKLPKSEIIDMLRETQTGTKDKKICGIETAQEAQHIVDGIINDFEAGIITKTETMAALGEYTARLMELFWQNAKLKFKSNPELLTP